MARSPSTTDKGPQQDVLPELDDDIEPVAAEASADPVDFDDTPDVDDEPERAETPREAAVRRYRELRDGKAKAAPDKDDEDAGDDPGPEAPAKASDPASAVAAAAKSIAASSTPTPVAADPDPRFASILEEIKALREDAKAPPKAEPVDDTADDGDQTPSAKTAADSEKLGSIVERIQIGDKEEGSLALAELIELLDGGKKGAIRAEDVGRVVTEQIARSRVVNEVEEATNSFMTKYDKIVADPDVLSVSVTRLANEVRQDLVSAGLDKAAADKATPEQLMEWHTQARIKNLKVRPMRDHFEKVGTDMTAKFSALLGSETPRPASRQSQPQQPAPSNRIAERMDRKRSAPVQPRTAGVRANTEPAQKPKSRSDVLMEMRRSRGFTA